MAADMQDVRSRATQFANGFTSGQKAMSAFALVAAIAGGLVYFHIAGRPSYQPLFTGLKSSDASSITGKLSSAGVPYQLADGGQTVLVPGKDVNAERLAMAADGLPANGGGGFSNLDKQGLTSSSASQQAAYQDDLQNELDSTIESIQGVTSANVAIALPQTDTFGVSSNSTTTASVLVGLGSGTTLNPTEVTSIVHLVAAAVPNLSPSNVTVADTNGNTLAAPGVNTDNSGSGCQAKSFDTSLSNSLDQLLATVAGPGNAQVQVAGTLDCNTQTTTSNGVQLAKNGKPIVVPTAKSSDSEIYNGAGANGGGGGVIGTTTAPATTSTTGSGAYTKTDTQQQYAVGTVNTTIKQAPGAITNLQIAVLLNTKANLNPTQVKTLISGAAGLQAKRGDKITVVSMPFSTATTTAAAAAAKAAAKAKKSAGLLSIGRTALLVIGLIVLILLLLRSSKKERRTAVALPYDGPQAQLLAAHQASLAAAAPRPAISSGGSEAHDLNEFIDSSPDEIADLLRSWTREDARS